MAGLQALTGVTRVTVSAAPAGAELELTPDAPSGTYTGSVSLPAGPQRLTARAFAGTTLIAEGHADVTISGGSILQVAIMVLDVTGPRPVPDHAAVLTSLTATASTLDVGQTAALTAVATDIDGDAISFVWTTVPAGCGEFSPASVSSTTDGTTSSTTMTAANAGICAVNVVASSKGLSDSMSMSMTIRLAVVINGSYVPQPLISSLEILSPDVSTTVLRTDPDATVRTPWPPGVPVSVRVSWDETPWLPRSTASLTDSCGGAVATTSAGQASETFSWRPTGGPVCQLNASVTRSGLVDTFPVAVLVASNARYSISRLSADPGAHHAGVFYPQPLAVVVTNQDGAPVQGLGVIWTADSGGWSVPSSSSTDASGQASALWAPGLAPHPTLTASISDSIGLHDVSFVGSTVAWVSPPDHLATSYSETFQVASGIARDVTPLTDPTGTYYAVLQWDNGYTGIARGGSYYDRQIQFSIWDYQGALSSIVDAGTSICQRFGHEGTGVMCSNEYPWVTGSTYRFEMSATASSSTTTDITVYFVDVASGTRKFIATLRQGGTPSLNWAVSFVEDFRLSATDCLTVPERRAIFGNTRLLIGSQWVQGPRVGAYQPWDPTLFCATQGYVVRPQGIEIGLGGTLRAATTSTHVPVSY